MWQDSDDDLDDKEYPDEPDDDSGETTAVCPYCHNLIYDEAEKCPECGNYLSREDRPWTRPLWLLLGVVICISIVLWWSFG